MNNNQWIDVKRKDKLPPKFIDVLVYSKFGNIKITCRDDSGEFDTYPLSSEDDGDYITHWRRLPEPPKSQQ